MKQSPFWGIKQVLTTRKKKEMRILQYVFKPILLSTVAIAAITFSHGGAKAGEVTISGSTSGTVTGVPQLTFAGNPSFTGATALGVGALSGLNSLGTFTLATNPTAIPANGTFNLAITFTAPAGISGGQASTYTANIA